MTCPDLMFKFAQPAISGLNLYQHLQHTSLPGMLKCRQCLIQRIARADKRLHIDQFMTQGAYRRGEGAAARTLYADLIDHNWSQVELAPRRYRAFQDQRASRPDQTQRHLQSLLRTGAFYNEIDAPPILQREMLHVVEYVGAHAAFFDQRQLLFVLANHRYFAAAQRKHLRRKLAHLAIAQNEHFVRRPEMRLLQDLKIGRQRLYEDRLLVAHVFRHGMQVLDRQHCVFGKGTVAVDDSERCAPGAMGWHVMLAVEAIGAVAGGVDLAHDALPDKVAGQILSSLPIDLFNDANEFMPRHTLKIHIAAHNLQVGVADTGLEHANERLTIKGSGHGIVAIKRKAGFPLYQCTHTNPPYLFPSAKPMPLNLVSPVSTSKKPASFMSAGRS